MTDFQKSGGYAALYLGTAYATGIALFLVVLDAANINTIDQKIAHLAANQTLLHFLYLGIYVVFGVVLVVFVLALYEKTKQGGEPMARFAAILGIMWAGLLVASGMVTIAGMAPALALYQTDPAQGALYWSGVETVAEGIGLGRGEILGGLMTVLFSLAALRGEVFPKLLNYLGLIVGAAGLVSTIPGLHDVAALFGLSQLIWFFWLGFVLLRGK